MAIPLEAMTWPGGPEEGREMTLADIAKDAAERAGKNAGVAPQLLYAPILWALQDAEKARTPTAGQGSGQ